MRLLILPLIVVALSGCQTAEFAVDHQITGLRVAAKFEARDRVAGTNESADSGAHWNGADAREPLRR